MKARSPRFLIFLTVFIDLLGFGIVIPIATYVGETYATGGLREFKIGMLMTSYSLCQVIFAPMWGRLSDRVGRRPILLMSLTGSVVSYALFGLANSYWMLLAARTFAGVFGANLTAAQAYIADVTEPEKRTSAMGLIGMAFGLGFAIGPVFGGVMAWIGDSIDPNTPDQLWPGLTAAAICLINVSWAAFALPESLPKEKRGLGLTEQRLAPMRETAASVRHPVIGPLVLVFFLSTIAFSNMEVSLGLYAKKEGALRLETDQVYGIFIYVGIVLAFMNGYAVRKLVKFIPETILVVVGTFAQAIALAIFPLVPSIAWMLFAMTILGFGQGITVPALLAMVSQSTSAQRQGHVMGVTQSASSLARIVGPVFAVGFWMLEGEAAGVADVAPTWPFYAGGAIMLGATGMAILTRRRILSSDLGMGEAIVSGESLRRES